jgi:hypothetical protein
MLKQTYKIEYVSGEEVEVVIGIADMARWEKTNNKSLTQMDGITPQLQMAYFALTRKLQLEEPTKKMKPFEVWLDTVADMERVGEEVVNPQ